MPPQQLNVPLICSPQAYVLPAAYLGKAANRRTQLAIAVITPTGHRAVDAHTAGVITVDVSSGAQLA